MLISGGLSTQSMGEALQALADQLHRSFSGPASGLTTRAGIPGQLAHHLLPTSAYNNLGPCPG